MSYHTFIGFDYGAKYIGVAVGQDLTQTASALTVIKADDGIPDWHDVATLLTEWHPERLIVGLPLNMDGSEQNMTIAARAFGQELNTRFNIPIAWQDERLTTYESLKTLGIDSKLKAKNRDNIDAISAQIILQSWLNEQCLT